MPIPAFLGRCVRELIIAINTFIMSEVLTYAAKQRWMYAMFRVIALRYLRDAIVCSGGGNGVGHPGAGWEIKGSE